MKKEVNKTKNRAVWMMSMVIAMSTVIAACSSNNGGNTTPTSTPASNPTEATSTETEQPKLDPLKLDIMIPAFNTDLPDDNSPIIKKLEEYTNTDVKIQFVPNSSYPDKVNITLVSGEIPHLMVVDRNSASFINAARSGAFWEIGPYLKDYPNLSMAHDVTLNNISIDGKVYGMYRERVLGRMGVILNRQWMDNLNLEAPKTIDEFYNVLKAFKENDPDQNGKDDTYGIVVSKYAGPWDIMQVWFGAPNKWGEDETGKLLPTHMFPEYREALKFFRQLYEEGLVNEDFAVMDSAAWNDPFVNGKAGAFVDVADNARRLDNAMQEKAPRDEPYTDVFQAPVGPKGHRDMPTSGYNGMLAISKSAVKTEEELKRVLTFLDQLSDVEMQLLLEHGEEGRHYELVDGYIKSIINDDPALLKEIESLNQLLTFVGPDAPTIEQTPINIKIADVQKANDEIVVGNPAEPLISEVYAQVGQQLDNIIADARIQYIVGQIDDAGLDAAIELWKKTGGDDYIEEINKLYQASK